MLLKSWAQSLRLLIPKNLTLFMLVTLKAVFDIGINKKMWVYLLMLLLLVNVHSLSSVAVAMSCCLFFLFIFVRPSVLLKNIIYVRAYFFRYSSLVILASVILFMAEKLYNSLLLRYALYLVGPLAPLTVFTILFLLDSENSIKNIFTSIRKSAKFILYNLPITALFYGLWVAIFVPMFSYVVDFVMSIPGGNVMKGSFDSSLLFLMRNLMQYVGSWAVFLVLTAFPIALLTNYYIKRVHDNFSLYE